MRIIILIIALLISNPSISDVEYETNTGGKIYVKEKVIFGKYQRYMFIFDKDGNLIKIYNCSSKEIMAYYNICSLNLTPV